MEKQQFIRLKSISECHTAMQIEKPKHPLISVIDFSKMKSETMKSWEGLKIINPFYMIMHKTKCYGDMRYGRTLYDFGEGSLFCAAPEQILAFENGSEEEEPNGWGVFFHPDLIRKYPLGKKMNDYSFFSYEANEALHLSDKEKQIINDCKDKIEIELNENIDDYSLDLIISNIEVLLNYANRFYGRQFITRKNVHTDLISKFDEIIKAYYNEERQLKEGLPTVGFLADELHLSASYLTDLLKKETGSNTQEHIHHFVIEKAKNKLLTSGDAVSDIAYDLGFEYPQYFSKIFKNKVGMTPLQYRGMN